MIAQYWMQGQYVCQITKHIFVLFPNKSTDAERVGIRPTNAQLIQGGLNNFPR